MKTDKEICEAATDGPWHHTISGDMACIDVGRKDPRYIECGEGYQIASLTMGKAVGGSCSIEKRNANVRFMSNFNPKKVTQMLDRQEQLESKLKESAEFIQKLGPTIDYEIVSEIEEILGE